jgi:hypothetical protein
MNRRTHIPENTDIFFFWKIIYVKCQKFIFSFVSLPFPFLNLLKVLLTPVQSEDLILPMLVLNIISLATTPPKAPRIKRIYLKSSHPRYFIR